MLCLSFFILETGFPLTVKKIIGKAATPIFGLGENCSEAIVLGLSGGYNTAVRSAVKLYSEGQISSAQAKRIALFFTNAGISFTVNITGTVLYDSAAAGLRLYITSVLINLLTAALYNVFHKNREECVAVKKEKNTAEAFVQSVKASSESIISICFNIVFFAAINSVASEILPFESLKIFLNLFGEVTSGIIFSSDNFNIPITAFCLSFGGICIFLQNLPDLVKLNIKPSEYLKIRLIQAFLCFAVEYIFNLAYPVSQSVFAENYSIRFYSGSFTGSFSLILLCVVFLFSMKDMHTKNTIRH